MNRIVSGSIMVPLDDQSSGRPPTNIQDQPVTDAFIDALSYVPRMRPLSCVRWISRAT